MTLITTPKGAYLFGFVLEEESAPASGIAGSLHRGSWPPLSYGLAVLLGSRASTQYAPAGREVVHALTQFLAGLTLSLTHGDAVSFVSPPGAVRSRVPRESCGAPQASSSLASALPVNGKCVFGCVTLRK
jgi:hypothetical protein